jgi:serine/threonine protein kinase
VPTEDEARFLLRETARAVNTLHAAGLLHRDLKPANVMIAENGLPKVLSLLPYFPDSGYALMSSDVRRSSTSDSPQRLASTTP